MADFTITQVQRDTLNGLIDNDNRVAFYLKLNRKLGQVFINTLSIDIAMARPLRLEFARDGLHCTSISRIVQLA